MELLELVEKTLDEVMPPADERPAALSEAMRYAVGTGGKRIRPLICLASSAAVGGKPEDARYAAAAIELLHNYTLVHDDLPAMDNDTERRGKPTVWTKYGEANAILAGDALQALAFAAAAKTPRNASAVVAALGAAALGVVQGQVEDIAATKDVPYIYTHKTADLFIAAATMGGYAGGGTDDDISPRRRFAVRPRDDRAAREGNDQRRRRGALEAARRRRIPEDPRRKAAGAEGLTAETSEWPVVKGLVVPHGKLRVLGVEGRNVGRGNLMVRDMLLVIVLRSEDRHLHSFAFLCKKIKRLRRRPVVDEDNRPLCT